MSISATFLQFHTMCNPMKSDPVIARVSMVLIGGAICFHSKIWTSYLMN